MPRDVRLAARIVRFNVSDTASVQAALAQLPELDVLINNAGILGTSFSVDDLDADAMTAVLDVNVAGVIRVTRPDPHGVRGQLANEPCGSRQRDRP